MSDRDSSKQNQPWIIRFFLGIMRAIRNYFIFIGVLVTALWVLFIVMLSRGPELDLDSMHLPHTVTAGSWLETNLEGRIVEREASLAEQVFSQVFGGEAEVSLSELREVFKRASTDQRLSGVRLSIGALSGTPAAMSELRRAIFDYRMTSSKPVEIMVQTADEWLYYVASAGTSLSVNPASPVTVHGPLFQLVYFGEALKRLGVGIDVVRAGRYKSAFEPFVQNEPSAETLEEYRALEESLRGQIIADVAAGRQKEVAVVREWYRKSIFTADDALKRGMIDRIGHGFPSDTPGGAPLNPNLVMGFGDYLDATQSDRKSQTAPRDQGGIALIDAQGEISLTGGSRPSRGSETGISPELMQDEIDWAIHDDKVKAVVLRISSPGGSAIASEALWQDLEALNAKKPLVVVMGDYAASGGYYMSVAGRYIVAQPNTITGSIGVIGMLPNAKQFHEKWGVSFHLVSGSDRRNMLNLGEGANDEDKALIDSTIKQVYNTFLARVAKGRNLELNRVANLAEGRVYTGLQAKELGLVDEIGGISEGFKAAKRLAQLDETKLYPILHYQGGSFSLSDCIGSPRKMAECMKRAESKITVQYPQDLRSKIESNFLRWYSLGQREGALALLPVQ